MPKKIQQDAIEPDSAQSEVLTALDKLGAGQLQDLARLIAQAAAHARAEGKVGPEDAIPKNWGSPRDPAVKRIAGIQLREWLAPEAHGGKGLSLRDVASMLDVSYERVRTLAKKLVPDYVDVVEERRTSP